MFSVRAWPYFPSAAAARAVLGFVWFPIVRARAPVAEGCDEINLGGFPPPKPSGVCFFGIDYLVGLARGGLELSQIYSPSRIKICK